MRFTDKVCIVTGGGSGIGQATCLRMAKEGGKIAVVGRTEAKLQDTVAQITKAGGIAIPVQCDISVPAQIQLTIQTVLKAWDRIDVVVNDAAYMTFKPVVDTTEEDWDKVMETNLKSTFLFCKYAVPHIKGGAIVNISSVHAHETTGNVTPYAASKGGD